MVVATDDTGDGEYLKPKSANKRLWENAVARVTRKDYGIVSLSFMASNPVDYVPEKTATLSDGEFHAFLSHDWGCDGSGRKTHERVKIVNSMLKRRGILTWFDEEQMEGTVTKAMADGIDRSHTCVVFVTKNYHDKVNGDNEGDNCQKEFHYAELRKTPKLLIPVVMEEASGDFPLMRRPTEWSGSLEMVLGTKLYIDLSADEKAPEFQEKVDELAARINKLAEDTLTQRVLGLARI